MTHPESYINFEVYEDGVRFCGITKVSLPEITYLTQTISGAGIAGNVEATLAGLVDAMSLGLTFRMPTEDAANLATPKRHNIDLRAAEQQEDTVSGIIENVADKYVMSIVPKKYTLGDVAPAATADASAEYSVHYYAAYKNGKKLWEIDPLNYICEIGGTDYLKSVRTALGR